MPMRERGEGRPTPGLGNLRRMMPYLMPSRNEAYVLFAQEVDAAPTRALAAELNRDRSPDRPVTQFHMLLRGLTRVFAEFPRLNRFVVGGRHYDRNGIWIAFSAKMRLDLDAPVFARKMRFAPEESLLEMVDRIYEVLLEGRSGRESASDKEVHAILRLPGFLRVSNIATLRSHTLRCFIIAASTVLRRSSPLATRSRWASRAIQRHGGWRCWISLSR